MPHLVEMALEIFGSEIQEISAMRVGNSITAVLAYPNDTVSLHFTDDNLYSSCLLFSKGGNEYYDIDYSDIYDIEACRFARMVQNEEVVDNKTMMDAVLLIDAIIRSAETGIKQKWQQR